jgi:hypothetical protein
MDETRDKKLDAMDESRDAELGKQLEAFGEPDHGPDYWRDVRLAVNEATAAEETAGDARRTGFGSRLRAAFVPRRARLALAAVAIAAVTATALLVGLPGTTGPQPVSAAEVLRRALAVPASIKTWQADIRVEMYDDSVWKKYHANKVRRVHVMRDAAGGRETYSAITAAGHRLEGPSEEVYPVTGEPVPYWDSEIGRWFIETNGPIGAPDAGTIPLLDIGLAVRALAASSTLRLGETVAAGRPAWTVTCTKGEMAGLPSTGDDATVYTVVVDKQTWNLLGVKEVKKGRVTFDLRFSNVRVNEPLPEDAFDVPPPPPGARIKRDDLGFHRVTLDQAAAVPGATTLVPRWMPAGYGLSKVTVADSAVVLAWVAAENRDASIRGRDVVTLLYERGWDALAISTRTVQGTGYSIDIDPCEGFDQAWSKRAHREVLITSGAFAGVTVRIVAASTSAPPHLWAVKDGVLLTIAGAASADELLSIAESLQTYPGSSPAAQ